MNSVRSTRRAGLLAAFVFLAVILWGCPARESSVDGSPGNLSSGAAPSPGSDEKRIEPAAYSEQVPEDTIEQASLIREIIQRAALTVRVSDAAEAAKRAERIVEEVKGFVEASSIEARTGAKPQARLTLRVPATKLTAVLDELEKLGTRISRNVSREDVTSQIVDMDARVRNLRAQEAALLEIFKRATKIADVMEVEQRLSHVRLDIERLEAQRSRMRELVALSTIELTLDESAVGLAGAGDPGWFSEGWAAATDAFTRFLRELALVGVWLAVFSPFWLPVGLWLVWLFVRSVRRARSREAMADPPT